jgi:putative sterol carrier protein
MALDALQTHLRRSFDPAAAQHLDAVIEVKVEHDVVRFRVRDGALEFDLPDEVRPDATFMFADVDTAWSLLSGRGDAFAAFMDGRFRSDGHLMWAFALMAMFRSSSLPASPTE